MPRKLGKRGGGGPGQIWVSGNHDIKRELREKNGGIMPETPAFTTSKLPYGEHWSEENPPDVLFYLKPPIPDFASQEPQKVVDNKGESVMSSHNAGKPLRKIPILPERISVDVTGWLMVAWRRIDPRITLQDIIDRMTPDLGDAQQLTDKRVTLPKKNSLQNHCTRNCRKALNYYNQSGLREEPHRTEVEAVEGLSANNVRYNTVLQYHPKYHRLIKVRFVRSGVNEGILRAEQLEVTAANWPDTTYPVDHFLYDDYDPSVFDSMKEAVSMLLTVQERALKHGLPASKWRKLKRSCLPISWYDRVKNKSQINTTYDGGCDVCTWNGPEDDDWSNVVIEKPLSRYLLQKAAAGKNDPIKQESNEYQKANHAENRLSSTTQTSLKRDASEFESSPAKRCATAPHVSQDILNNFKHDSMALGAWGTDEQSLCQHTLGEIKDEDLDDLLQAPVEQLMDQASYSEQCRLPDQGYAAVNELTFLREQENYNTNSNSLEGVQAHPLHSFGSQQYTCPSVNYNHTPLSSTARDPMIGSAEAGIDCNDPDISSMSQYSQMLTQSRSQPFKVDADAAGVG